MLLPLCTFVERRGVMKVIASLLILLIAAVTVYAADVDGTWTGTLSGPQGDVPLSFTFKAEGAKLTGSTAGFDGGTVPIQDGKIDGNTITFNVTFDFGGMPFMISYKGVVSADQIKVAGDAAG